MRTSEAHDFTNRHNWNTTYYVINDAWCTHCEEPPRGIKHAGWYWELKNKNVTMNDFLQTKDLNKTLFLISKDKIRMAVYWRTTSYIPNEEEDISIDYKVGRD